MESDKEMESKTTPQSWWGGIVAFNNDWMLGTRIKILVFDIGLFGTDVITDWVNGSNMIKRGDVIWGGIMVSLPFLPMTIALLYFAFGFLRLPETWRVGLFLLLFLLPLAAL